MKKVRRGKEKKQGVLRVSTGQMPQGQVPAERGNDGACNTGEQALCRALATAGGAGHLVTAGGKRLFGRAPENSGLPAQLSLAASDTVHHAIMILD